MFEWILIAIVIVAIFYAGDLPKFRAFVESKMKVLGEKAKEKKSEVEAKMSQNKEKKVAPKDENK